MRPTLALILAALLLASALAAPCRLTSTGCAGCRKSEKCLVSGAGCACVPRGFASLFAAKRVKHVETGLAGRGDCKGYDEPCAANEECCSLYCKKDTGRCHFF